MAPVVAVGPDAVFVVFEVLFEEPHEASNTAHTTKKLRVNQILFLFTFDLTISSGKTDSIYEPEITSILYTILTQLDASVRRGCP